jgi:catechol 2,3-dioxygenase-like lactoylglutathione lyase family enzyme
VSGDDSDAVHGVRGLEHVGLTVPDIEQAVQFFVEVLGFEHMYDIGPFVDDEGSWFGENLNVDVRASIPRGALLRCGYGSNLELFEYRSPDQRQQIPRMSDWGGTHFAYYVDDMASAVAALKRHGVRVLGGIKDGIGVEAGEASTFIHFLSPWGQLIEFVSFPHGKRYMEGRKRLLWRPTAPAE